MSGKVRKGQEMSGKVRQGQSRSRKGQEKSGKVRKGQERSEKSTASMERMRSCCLRFQSYSFGNSGPHAKFQNRSLPISGLY